MLSGTRRDVIVVGGGPAGAATAALLAMNGRDVLLLDREEFPRYRIGESLMPATYWTFQRLGVLEKMHAGPFVKKESVRFFAPSGRGALPFYFDEVEQGESSITWQVDRAPFDKMLLDHAAEKGVEVRTGVNVTDLLMERERVVGVQTSGGDRDMRSLPGRVVVDASGQNGLLARRLGLRVMDPGLRHVSYFTRFHGGLRDSGRDAGATLILRTGNGDSWFWSIPLSDDLVSVGVVGHIDYLLKGRSKDAQEVFTEERALCPPLEDRLQGATQEGPVQVLRDFSYISSRIAGDGWVLVGDAFGFLDPIYSSGVFLALKSAEYAADSIHEALAADDLLGSRLGRHGEEFVAGVESLRRLVYAFYDDNFSFAKFLRHYPQAREDLVNLLVGNVYRRDCSGLIELLDRWAPLPDYRPLRLSHSAT
ncbi:MAG: NAD(P)/FAD-dependent oxidoreductase [Acidobacteria bacterium]|nr:NAD(P)/FAD-dependent oxidoreductase [Acidobacteriota bacterium]